MPAWTATCAAGTRAAITRRPGSSSVTRSRSVLALELAIDLGTEQQNHQRKPQPGEEPHRRAEVAIDAVVAAEMLDIPAEQPRACEPEQRCGGTSPGDPAPFGMLAV